MTALTLIPIATSKYVAYQYNGKNFEEINNNTTLFGNVHTIITDLKTHKIAWKRYDGVETTHYELNVGDYVVFEDMNGWVVETREFVERNYKVREN